MSLHKASPFHDVGHPVASRPYRQRDGARQQRYGRGESEQAADHPLILPGFVLVPLPISGTVILCLPEPSKGGKRRDKALFDAAVGDGPDPPPELDTRNPAAVALSKLGASKGRKARAANITPRQRTLIAKRAAMKRWQQPRNEARSVEQ